MTIRNAYLDVVKGIAITLVVFAHCIQFGSGHDTLLQGLHFEHWLFKLIYTFHMPVFMLISGYLFYFSLRRHSFSESLSSRFVHLLLPVLVWQTLWIIAEHFLNWCMYPNITTILTSYTGELWFLFSLFINSTCMLFIHYKCHSLKSKILVLSFFPLSLFIPYHLSISLYVFMFPYFVCGYLFNSLKLSRYFPLSSWKTLLIIIVLLCIFLLMYIHYHTEHYVYTTGTSIISYHRISLERISVVLFRWTIGFIGSALFLLVVWCLNRLLPLKLFVFLGMTSLGIYIISTYVFKFFHLLPSYINNNLIINTLQCIIVMIISWGGTKILSNYKTTKFFLLGG